MTKSLVEIMRAPHSHWVGDGFRVRSLFSYQGDTAAISPFLLLDYGDPHFFAPNTSGQPRGVGQHPHRGFETVTYMIEGHMLHEDHLGNRGNLRNGGVQWMTAGRGIVHSEMPQQESGVMRGFQLWLNLPAAEKMKPAGYRDIQPEEIPIARQPGVSVRVIAGELEIGGGAVTGAITGGSTEPVYADVHLEPGARVSLPVPQALNALVYLYEGVASLVSEDRNQALVPSSANILDQGDEVLIEGGEAGAKLLLIAGRPIGEPVVQYGPFVMNTTAEIEQALADYRDGTLTV